MNVSYAFNTLLLMCVSIKLIHDWLKTGLPFCSLNFLNFVVISLLSCCVFGWSRNALKLPM